MHTNHIQRKSTICKAGSKITNGQRQNKKDHPTSVWKVPIPRTSSGQHSSVSNQRHSFAISKSHKKTLESTHHLLDYLGTQEEAILTYNASKMVLAAHSNASYLSKPDARSRAGGHFFLSSNSTIPQNNGAVLNIAHTIKHVMSSATEAELAGLYIMAR